MWWNSTCTISHPKRCFFLSVTLSMSANLENSAVAMGLDKVSFHPNLREGQCQRIFKLPYNWVCTKSFMLGFKSSGTKNIQMCKFNYKGAEEWERKEKYQELWSDRFDALSEKMPTDNPFPRTSVFETTLQLVLWKDFVPGLSHSLRTWIYPFCRCWKVQDKCLKVWRNVYL